MPGPPCNITTGRCLPPNSPTTMYHVVNVWEPTAKGIVPSFVGGVSDAVGVELMVVSSCPVEALIYLCSTLCSNT